MDSRLAIIQQVAALIPSSNGSDCTLIAVDGRDGSGKTIFANELVTACKRASIRPVIQISIDNFHNQRALRYRLGKTSPAGFYHDSYDYQRFSRYVLGPLGAGGSRQYKSRSHDLETDEILDDEPFESAPPDSIVIIDGLFLHRPELVDEWQMSIYLHVSPEICAERMMVRDGNCPQLVPEDRYFGGLLLYLESCKPQEKATVVIDNSQIASPVILHRR